MHKGAQETNMNFITDNAVTVLIETEYNKVDVLDYS